MILRELAELSMKRAAEAKARVSLEELRERALALPGGDFRFERALKGPELAFICEIKKASPSKGIISESFPYLDIARDYEAAGAECVSCLTEPSRFMGSDGIFREIRSEITLPMLRKDFTVDEYQLYEAKCLGADAVLLICALLETQTIAKFLSICDRLGLSALVEAHDEAELRSASSAGARLIGVNNRNLKDFTVDLSNAARLREKLPPGALFVAESGISSPADAAVMKAAGADAVLLGEALMRASDRRALLSAFRSACR